MKRRAKSQDDFRNVKKFREDEILPIEIVMSIIMLDPSQWSTWMCVSKKYFHIIMDLVRKLDLNKTPYSVSQLLTVMGQSNGIFALIYEKCNEYIRLQPQPFHITVKNINHICWTRERKSSFCLNWYKECVYTIAEDDIIDHFSAFLHLDRSMDFESEFRMIPTFNPESKVETIITNLIKHKIDINTICKPKFKRLVCTVLSHVTPSSVGHILSRNDSTRKLIVQHFNKIFQIWNETDANVIEIFKCMADHFSAKDIEERTQILPDILVGVGDFSASQIDKVRPQEFDEIIARCFYDGKYLTIFAILLRFGSAIADFLVQQFQNRTSDLISLYALVAEKYPQSGYVILNHLRLDSHREIALTIPLPPNTNTDIYFTNEFLLRGLKIDPVHICIAAMRRTRFLNKGTYLVAFFDYIKNRRKKGVQHLLLQAVAQDICQSDLPIFDRFFITFGPLEDHIWTLDFVRQHAMKKYATRSGSRLKDLFVIASHCFANLRDSAKKLLLDLLMGAMDMRYREGFVIQNVFKKCVKYHLGRNFHHITETENILSLLTHIVNLYEDYLDDSDYDVAADLGAHARKLIWKSRFGDEQ